MFGPKHFYIVVMMEFLFPARYIFLIQTADTICMATDPALSDYIPLAPVNDEAKKYNRNLPGMGGIYNTVNFHLYHYAGNNPVKYTDPDGRVIAELAMTRLIIEVGKAEPQIIGAIYDFISQYKKMKDENVIGNDHYNHAMANSRATLRGKYGKMTAQILSFVREVTMRFSILDEVDNGQT